MLSVKYLVWIYMPKEKSYDFAGFTTSLVSHTLADVQTKTAASETAALAILGEIRTHDTFAAVVPSEFVSIFTHEFLNYAQGTKHEANLGIAIRAYSDEETIKYGYDQSHPKPLYEQITMTRRAIATLKLMKSQFLTFNAAGTDSLTLSFKATGGDKFILGAEAGLPPETSFTTEHDV